MAVNLIEVTGAVKEVSDTLVQGNALELCLVREFKEMCSATHSQHTWLISLKIRATPLFSPSEPEDPSLPKPSSFLAQSWSDRLS